MALGRESDGCEFKPQQQTLMQYLTPDCHKKIPTNIPSQIKKCAFND